MLWFFILIDPLPYEAVRLGIVINSSLETAFLALKFMPKLVGFLEVPATTSGINSPVFLALVREKSIEISSNLKPIVC